MSTSYLLKGGIVATYGADNKPHAFKADVLVEDSVIVKIDANISAKAGVDVIDCTDKWITPGMVDTHRHVWMSILKGVQDDWLLTEYLVKEAWYIQGDVTSQEVYIGQLAGCLEALDSGVTTILDHFHAANTPAHAEAGLKATVKSGIRSIICPARQSPPTKAYPELEFAKEMEIAEAQTVTLKEWSGRDGGKLSPDGRVVLGLAYDLVTYGLPMEMHQSYLKMARELNIAIITSHIISAGPILKWKEGGILGPDVVFSHCNGLYDLTAPDDPHWAALKEYGAAIASTPEDELAMAHGNPVAFEAVERGVKCGLGIDCMSINSGDIITQMRFALQYWRGQNNEKIQKSGVPTPKYNKFNAADAFRLGTLGGAEALNLSKLIGTVEVGKKADLVIFDRSTVNLAGIEDPFKGIVFHATNADIEIVLVNGEIVKKDGKLCKVPWPTVAKELKEKKDNLRSRWPDVKLEKLWSEYYDNKGAPILP